MKKIFIKKTIAAVLTSVTLVGVLPMAASAETKTGWILDGGKWHFYNKDGAMAKNTTITYEGEQYTFDSDGAWDMKGKPHLEFKDGKCYYYDKDAVMQKNTTVTYEGKNYKLDETGAVNQGGALSEPGELFVEEFNDYTANIASTNGEMKYDKDAKKSYFLDDSGNKVSGWVAYRHEWHYFDKTTGYQVMDTTIDGHKIDKNGIVVDKNLNLTTSENAHKNTDAYKATNKLWKKEGNDWSLYNELNEKLTGWQSFRGDWYYFDKNGVMQKNTTIKVGDRDCKLGEDGAWCN